MYTFTQNYSFRRFIDNESNRAKQLPAQPDHELQIAIEDQTDESGALTGKQLFKRATETYTLSVPTPAELGVSIPEGPEGEQLATVLQHLFNGLVISVGRTLVDAGVAVTEENASWNAAVAAEYTRLMESGGSGPTYSKELLVEVADAFAAYMAAIGKPEAGITAMVRMIKARFDLASTAKFIQGLDAIIGNLTTWLSDGCTEEEQTSYLSVVEYLVDRAEKAKEPPKVDPASLF